MNLVRSSPVDRPADGPYHEAGNIDVPVLIPILVGTVLDRLAPREAVDNARSSVVFC